MTLQWTRDTSIMLPTRETQVLSLGVIRTGEKAPTKRKTPDR